MNSKLLSRRQYDWLIENKSNWMATEWKTFKTKWFLGGVRVTSSPDQIKALEQEMETCPHTHSSVTLHPVG